MSSFNASITSGTSLFTVSSPTPPTSDPPPTRDLSTGAASTGIPAATQFTTHTSSDDAQDANSLATTRSSNPELPSTSIAPASGNVVATQTSKPQSSGPSISSIPPSSASNTKDESSFINTEPSGTSYVPTTQQSNVAPQTTGQVGSTESHTTKMTVLTSVSVSAITQSISAKPTTSVGLLSDGGNIGAGKPLSTGARVAIGVAAAFVILGLAVFVAWLGTKRRAQKKSVRNSFFDLNYQLPLVDEKPKVSPNRASTPFLYRGVKQPQASLGWQRHSRVNRFQTPVRPRILEVQQKSLPGSTLHAFHVSERVTTPLTNMNGAMSDQYHDQLCVNPTANSHRRQASSVYSVSSQSSQQQPWTPDTHTRTLVAQIHRENDDQQNLVHTLRPPSQASSSPRFLDRYRV